MKPCPAQYQLDLIEDQGRSAHRLGKPLSDNPHDDIHSDEWWAWDMGWRKEEARDFTLSSVA